MSLTRLSAPQIEPVDLQTAKKHLRVDHSYEDDVISRLIQSAREQIEIQSGISFLPQSWRLTINSFPQDGILLRRTPLIEVSQVAVIDSTGVFQPIDAGNYYVTGMVPPRLVMTKGADVPGRYFGGIQIDFRCGFENQQEIPSRLIQALLNLVAHNYEHRQLVDQVQQYQLPNSIAAMVQPYRVLNI